jgi:hypothetical protein
MPSWKLRRHRRRDVLIEMTQEGGERRANSLG